MLRRYSRWRGCRRSQDPISVAVREHVRQRDGGCVFRRLGVAHDCFGALELDHVRASGGLGLRSRSTGDNLVTLCPVAHREKTLHGRKWRPILLDWVERAERGPS